MTANWQVADAIRDSALGEALASLDSCFALKGMRLTQDPKSVVTRHELDGKTFYVKRYTKSGKYLRKYLGRSRVRAEWENLQLFRQWGIATPAILACGEEKACGRFVRGALVTAGLDGACDLEQLARQHSPLLFEREHFRQLARQVADFTRRMHQHRFAHNDLDWRNILVVPPMVEQQQAAVYFFDCPGGRFWLWPFLEYRVMKDLAHLDKLAREFLPLRWRLWFYHQYTGRRQLTAADKRRLRRIARYYEGRD